MTAKKRTTQMHLNEFVYDLPQELIAQYPLKKRDQARLMVIDRQKQTIVHDIFANIGRHLPPKTCIVRNDSKVIAARLFGYREKSAGRVEVFLLKRLSDGCSYEALIRPLNKLKANEKIRFNGGCFTAELIDKERRIVRFNPKDISPLLEQCGHVPLPPYIKRPDESVDRRYYQTVYARHPGSVASPTAGLHFTRGLLRDLKKDRHSIINVTLHVNHATFRPVKDEDITKHTMHHEDYAVSPKAQKIITEAQGGGSPIVAIGTTSCRVLETMAQEGAFAGSTNIFIYPGYQFRMADILVTNFHLPRSTLLMLVYAFGGTALMKRAYEEAIKSRYRFYSYGDAMVIL